MIAVGVIGVGRMGQNHTRLYSEIASLVGISDCDKSAKRIAKRFNITFYSDYSELLKVVDAVSVATPTKTHFRIAMDCIRAGKHLLIEKPISYTPEEAEQLIQATREQGVTLAVGHTERHNPVVQSAKSALDRGQFGKIVSMAARRVSAYPPRVRDVGVIMDLATHDIDILNYFAASKVESVYAVSKSVTNSRQEDCANILLTYENGICGVIETNWLTPMKVRRMSITCSKKFVELDYINQVLQVSSSTFKDLDMSNLYMIPQEYDVQIITLKKQEPLRNELIDFLSAIETKREPLVTGEQALYTLKIAQAALDSSREGKVIGMG